MYPLAVCSLLTVSALIYKLMTLRRRRIAPLQLIDDIEQACRTSDISRVQGDNHSVLGRLVQFTLQNRQLERTRMQELLATRARLEFNHLQAGIALLELMVQVAPMLGILGTAWGLVGVFSVFESDANQLAIAQNISLALYTTVCGLAIAAPAIIGQISSTRCLDRHASTLEALMAAWLQCLYAGANPETAAVAGSSKSFIVPKQATPEREQKAAKAKQS